MTSVWVAILILSPLVGFLINGFRWKSKNYLVSGSVATLAVAVSFIASINLLLELVSLPADQRTLIVKYFDWINVGTLTVPMGFMVDTISAVMILIITGVGTLIHLFSVGYMSHDEHPTKYFAYLNLFVFNMLLLVLGENLLIMFIGWEGVGLCSYLLIGFWFTDKEKAAAGMKAFITNRVGDAGLLIGIFLIFMLTGTLSFVDILASNLSPEANWGIIGAACMALFVGATGKSAQIPLYVWLPDAMAGPTPVSALIHAATMVTAGIYMIVRLNPFFMLSPNSMMVIAIIGGLTAFFAASMGILQWDIKKILAYSTVSQLGYMFLALGVGAFTAAMFHLMTHAFFKALMFLGSGSVIHAMHEEQDIRKMGGLKKYLPITHFTFLMGWLAIIGTPFFSGFFSKDEILWLTFHSPMGSKILWVLAIATAGMTAFYMTRLMTLTFWGKSRVPKEIHPHESPPAMTIPLIVLAVLSVFGGWLGVTHAVSAMLPGHIPNILEHWFGAKITAIPNLAPASLALEYTLMAVSILVAGGSAFWAYTLYTKKQSTLDAMTKKMKPVHTLVYNKYFVDEFYFSKIINPIVDASKGLWEYIDVGFIDKITYKLSEFVNEAAKGLRNLQNGNVQRYALYMLIGLFVTLSFVFLR
jgi:NADH-quinone oxidoreductase subunit L